MTYTLNKIASDKTNLSAKRFDGIRVHIDSIKVIDGFNVRFHDDELREHIAALAGALASGLPVPPIEVYVDPETGAIELVDGHCRLQAYRQFAIACPDKFDGYIDAVKFDGSPRQRKVRIATSNGQLKLKATELGRLYVSLRDEHGMSRQEIASEVGKSLGHIDQMILLVSGGDEIIQAVEREEISATEAVKLVREHGESAPEELERRKEVARESGSERVTAKVAPPKKAPSRPRVDFVTSCAVVLVNSLTDQVAELVEAGESKSVEVDAMLLADLIGAVREMQQAGKALDADKHQEIDL